MPRTYPGIAQPQGSSSRFIPISLFENTLNVATDIPGVAAAIGDINTDVFAIINAFINANTELRTNSCWLFPAGIFYHKVDLYQLNLLNVAVVGEPGATAQKVAGIAAVTREYSFFTKNSRNVCIDGIDWKGVTTSLSAYAFGGGGFNADSGIYMASSANTRVTNCTMTNFGDAAIRMTTSPDSPANIDSSDGLVAYNTFHNCTQVTTTPNGSVVGGVGKGGCNNFQVIGNKAYNLKGSFKAACRYPTTGALFKENYIECAPTASSSCGIESLSVSSVQILDNQVRNAANWAIHIYPNGESSLNKFEWDSVTVDRNTLTNNYRGIRANNAPYAGNGQQANPANVNITNNTITGITYNVNSTPAALVYSGGNWESGQCKGNIMSGIANGVFTIVQTNITASGNTPS